LIGLSSALSAVKGRHHLLKTMAREENFERLRKMAGLKAGQLYYSDRLVKGIGKFEDVVRNGYIQNHENTMDLEKLAQSYKCVRQQFADQPLGRYTGTRAFDPTLMPELLLDNLDHV